MGSEKTGGNGEKRSVAKKLLNLVRFGRRGRRGESASSASAGTGNQAEGRSLPGLLSTELNQRLDGILTFENKLGESIANDYLSKAREVTPGTYLSSKREEIVASVIRTMEKKSPGIGVGGVRKEVEHRVGVAIDEVVDTITMLRGQMMEDATQLSSFEPNDIERAISRAAAVAVTSEFGYRSTLAKNLLGARLMATKKMSDY